MARILLVDDKTDVLRTENLLLTATGHTVTAVTSGCDAVTMLESQARFDLLITDIRMDPTDGIEVLKTAQRLRPELPSIVISAYLSDPIIEQAKQCGCRAYIHKPFNMELLFNAVREALSDGTGKAEGD